MTGNATGPRVLVVPASYFAPNRTVGGGERYATEYAKALARLTHTTLGLFDLSPAERTEEGLRIRHFRARHFSQRWGFPMSREAWQSLGDYDLLHIMVFPTPLTDLLLLRARLRGQKVVLTDVGGGGACWSTYLHKLRPGWSLNRLAHGLAHLSEHAASFFAGWKAPRAILYGGVNLQELQPSTERGSYALTVGRLLPHKGALEVVEAVAPATRLHVVGRPYDAAYFEKLKSAAQGKNVQFFTEASDAEVKRQMAGAGVILQPSIPEGSREVDKSELLGLAALEAMACARPVIVTRAGSLPELVADGETGFIVPPRDLAALRSKIELLLGDPALQARMGAAGRARVEKVFTWEQSARRGLELYRKVMGGAHG